MKTADPVTFDTYVHAGDTQIAQQRITLPDSHNTPGIMFCGGFHSSMQGTKASAIMALCQNRDWRCTLFDYRGHGQSGGTADQFTLNDWLDDTLAVLEDQPAPVILTGSSMGAWLATLAALRMPEKVAGLFLLAAAPDFIQELMTPRLSSADIWDLQQGNAVQLPNSYDGHYPVTQALLESASSLSLLQGDPLNGLHCPVRMVHGMNDTDVPHEFSTRLLGQLPAQHDARLTLLHGADHRLSDERCLTYINQELARLIKQVHD